MELVIDKFILRRPSYRELGIENKVSTILTSKTELYKMVNGNTEVEGYKEALDIINEDRETTIVNYDKIPMSLMGIVAHENDGCSKLYSIDYFKKKRLEVNLYTEDQKYKLTITTKSYSIQNFDSLLKDKDMFEFGYIVDKEYMNASPVHILPLININGTSKYMRGRILHPILKLKPKYQNLLVNDVSDFIVGETTSISYEDTDNSSNRDTFESPIFTYVNEGMKHLESNSEDLDKELTEITEEDFRKYGTENKDRILAIKLSLSLINIPM